MLAARAAPDHEAKASYAVTVRAADGHGNAAELAVTIAVTDQDEPPLAPAGLAVAAQSVSSLRGDVDGAGQRGAAGDHGLRRAVPAGRSGAWSDHAHSGTITNADIGSLSPDTGYQVRVRAKNAEGDGAWTQPASGTTTALSVPVAPTGLGATGGGRTVIDLAWTAPASAESRAAVTGYDIEWSATGAGGWTDLVTVGATATAHSDTGMDPDTTRHYRVRATSSAGAGAWSSVESATTDANAAPVFTAGVSTTRRVAENTAAGQNVGAAVAATDADGDPLSYALSGAGAASFEVASGGQITVKSGALLDHEATGRHAVTVGVSDGYGGSGSITVTITVTDRDEPPAAPVGLTVAEQGVSSLRATWTAPGNVGRPAITGYDVQYREGTSGPWSDHAHGGTATSADIGGLSPDTAYLVRVRAANAEGQGAWTTPASGTTTAVETQIRQAAAISVPSDWPLIPRRVNRPGRASG